LEENKALAVLRLRSGTLVGQKHLLTFPTSTLCLWERIWLNGDSFI